MIKHFYVILFIIVGYGNVFGQCGSGTPEFIVDLSNDPNEVWLSPSVFRNDSCCGTDENCVKFIVTLNPLAEGVIFDIAEGAIPGGALFYQVDCGMSTNLDEAICLFGVGPHIITFCKPGNNENIYSITSVAEPGVDDEISVTEGCSEIIGTVGFEPSSLIWRSTFPGAINAYNSYLDCTSGCDTVTVTPGINPPPYVDYQVCGFNLGLCDTNGYCETVRVFFYDSLEVVISPINPMVCYGGVGTTPITANPIGGDPPHNYLWSTGDTTQTIDVGVGTYSVQVSDSSGCYPVTNSITVGEFIQEITADAGPDQIVCNQSPQVQLSASVMGVSTGTWIGGQGLFIPDRDDLNAIYQPTSTEVDIGYVYLLSRTTNNADCPADSDLVYIEFEGFISTINAFMDSSTCYQSDDGSAYVEVDNSYDSLTYTYLWNDPLSSTTPSILNLSPGVYTVLITDSIACDSSVSIIIEEPDKLIIDSISTVDLMCFEDSSGQATVYANGGNTSYQYNWGVEANNQTTQTAINLSAGNYNPSVTDSKGCFTDTILTVNEPSELILSVDSIYDLLCFNDTDAQVTVSASGGTPSYFFVWDQSTGSQTGQTASNLSSGVYSVVVLDSQTCFDTLEITIANPLELTAIAQENTAVSCFGFDNGSAEVTINGGVQPYAILWDSLASYQTTAIANNLISATYSVEVSDSNNCITSTQVFISQPDSALLLLPESQNISCFGLNNGSALVNAYGGTQPYSYLWSSNAGNSTTEDVNDLSPGDYTVWVNDINNCVDSLSYTITQPELLEVTSTESMVLCFEGNTGYSSLDVIGGSPPYTYLWDGNTDNQTTPIAISLSAGVYGYSVVDANLCIDSGFVTITQPTAVEIQPSNNQDVCAGTVVQLSAQASGGVGPYTYYWADFGLGQSQSVIANQTTIYQVAANDSLGCSSGFDSTIVSVMNIYLDSLITSNGGGICEGGSTTIEAYFNGTNGPYSYTWNNNLGSSFGPIQVSPIDSTWYIFTVTDECSNSLSDSTLVEIYPTPIIDIQLSESEGCAPFEVIFINETTQDNINYVWIFGDGGGSSEANPIYTYDQAGEYLVELQAFSIYGCSANSTNDTYVTVYAPPTSDFEADPWQTDITEPSIQFTNTSSEDAIFFTWSFGDGDSIMVEDPLHIYQNVGEFMVVLETENLEGCISSVAKQVIISPDYEVIIPNAFTPNINGSSGGKYDPQDLSNDIFYPFADYIKDFHMMIFNRWGELIFESTDINTGWDGYYKGKLAQIDVYVYKLEITFVDLYSTTKQGQFKLVN